MKKLALFTAIISMFSGQVLFSQTYVSTEPLDKNVILEEFTGVNCPNCPAGHEVAQQILDDNPGRVWVIGFHPFNSNFTTPYPGDLDFRRHHPDSLYMTPYCGSSRFMPSAFINRRVYAGERIQSRTQWPGYTTQFLTEPSPVNVGLFTTYDDSTKQLEILVEIYYSGDMTDINTLNVLFTESGLVAQQSGGTVDYIHKRVFRETFTAQWGDIITESTLQGSFIQETFTFDNSAEEYNMEECEVVAYIVNDATTEVISGIGVHVGGNTNLLPPEAEFEANNQLVLVGESITFTDLSTNGPETWEWTFEGGTPSSFDLQSPPPILYEQPGEYEVSLTVTNQNGSSTETKSDYIQAGFTPDVDFTYDIVQNPNETVIDFTDLSANNPTSWEWTFEGGTPETSTEQHPTGIVYTVSGNYDITLLASNVFGSNSESQTINVDVLSNIKKNIEEAFNTYPNPTSGKLYIDMENKAVESIYVYNSLGKLVFQDNDIHNDLFEIDLSSLEKGVYFLKIKTQDNTFTRRIIYSK